MNAKFVVIEGLEGSGKSTAIATVIATLKQLGVNQLTQTREPGGTGLAEKLRELVKHESYSLLLPVWTTCRRDDANRI